MTRPAASIGTLNELFAASVRRFSGATALVRGDTRLTYADLDAMSDHYAVELEEAGIGPGDIVPVVMGRTPEMVTLLLAVLKRGAAYAAMDPQWPAGRQVALISRLRPRLVVAAAAGSWREPTWVPPRYDPAGPRRRPTPVSVSEQDRCVVCFTSGTTGKPKAVVTPHRALARLFGAESDWMPLGPAVTMPQISAWSWDGFVIDCWGPLMTGGTAVLVDQPILVPAALSELTGRYGANSIFLTTSLFNLLVDEGADSFAGLHTVAIGGEEASPAHIKRFMERYPDKRVVNIYGPMECGVLVTTHDVRLADCDGTDGIPLGLPVAHTSVHVLDGSRPCDEGELGEVCVAGAALATGYLDDDELTATKFTEVSIDGETTRVYRTGDLGHWNDERKLCFDGRVDRQVQVHGHRVEPIEIEQAAARVTGVTMAAVVPLRRDGFVDAIALFYTSSRTRVTEAGLRAELRQALPHYLVPRLIRRLERFPQLQNGKLDHQLLEMIISAAESDARQSEGPRDATETAVAGILAEILRVPSVPREASLFDLGGDSLAVARVCARLADATGKRIQVSQVFRTPTAAGLAAWLAAEPGQDSDAGPAAGPDSGRLIALPPMQALTLPAPVVSELAWWIDGPVDSDALARAATDVHRRHQALHARYLSSGPDQGHALLPADPGQASFSVLPQARTDAEAIEALRASVGQPARLDEGEIWRCALVASAASGRFLFGSGVHHSAFDGWSAGILARELSTAYAARVAGAEPDFGAAPATLADFEVDYRAQLGRTSLDAQRQYWRSQLDQLPACHFPGRDPDVDTFMGPVAAPVFPVEPAKLRSWEAYGRSLGLPPFVWTAAACTEALTRAGAPADFCFMVPVAKRGSVLLDRSIACRMGSIFLRPNGPVSSASGLLGRTRDAYVSAMAAQDLFLDFREVEDIIGKWAETPAMPAMPVLQYHDNPAPALRLGSVLGAEEEAIGGWETSIVDLCLEVRPAAPEKFLRVAIRNDLYPGGLADSIGRHFREIISAGPERFDD